MATTFASFAGDNGGGPDLATVQLANDLSNLYLRITYHSVTNPNAGTVATVTGFYLLVPDATELLGDGTSAPNFPAPAAHLPAGAARPGSAASRCRSAHSAAPSPTSTSC